MSTGPAARRADTCQLSRPVPPERSTQRGRAWRQGGRGLAQPCQLRAVGAREGLEAGGGVSELPSQLQDEGQINRGVSGAGKRFKIQAVQAGGEHPVWRECGRTGGASHSIIPATDGQPTRLTHPKPLASSRPQLKAEGPLLLVNLNFTHKPRFGSHLLCETLPACCSILNTLSSTQPCAVLH